MNGWKPRGNRADIGRAMIGQINAPAMDPTMIERSTLPPNARTVAGATDTTEM